VVEPVVGAAGYDLEDLALSRAGRRTLVRVTVDRDGGMGLDAIAEVSRAVSAALDKAEEDGGELLPGEYELEVSSRGVDRPLTLPRHWRRNTGRLVKVTAAGRQLTGRVTTVDDGGVVIDVDGTAHEVGFADLGPGRVQVEFTRLDEVGEADPEDEDDEDDDFDDEAALDDDELEDEER
jgi:ribosome maturation factor RimP